MHLSWVLLGTAKLLLPVSRVKWSGHWLLEMTANPLPMCTCAQPSWKLKGSRMLDPGKPKRGLPAAVAWGEGDHVPLLLRCLEQQCQGSWLTLREGKLRTLGMAPSFSVRWLESVPAARH